MSDPAHPAGPPRGSDASLDAAYAHCLAVARAHYENFPVASILMPAALRPHIAAVYAFARAADDMADEGELSAGERLAALADWRTRLEACIRTEGGDARPDNPVFLALGDTIRRFSVPVQLFHDLLDAFVQDVTVESYATFDDVLDYCRRSANPVGRIMLALFGLLDERTAAPSDALCTGLQLANFWQDISVDARKPRVYIPEEDLLAANVRPEDVLSGTDSPALRSVVAFEVERTRRYFSSSASLFPLIPFSLRKELEAVWHGGMRILAAIERSGFDTVRSRPALTGADKLLILLRLMFPVHVAHGPHARH